MRGVIGRRVVHVMLALGVVCVIWTVGCRGQSEAGRGPRRRQRVRNTQRENEGLSQNLRRAYMSAVSGATSPSPSGNAQYTAPAGSQANSAQAANNPWQRYAPSVPAANEVECFVEVVEVRQQGGRCTQLGGNARPYICQSGPNFEFDPGCQEVIQNRNNRQAEPAS